MLKHLKHPIMTSFISPLDLLLTFLLSLPLLVLLCTLLRRRIPTPLPRNWPFVGMLPAFLSNLHRIHDFTVDLLRPLGATTVINGPWVLMGDVLLTADPANTHHVFSSNFYNYPKGPSYAEIFDVLGEGIFNSDFDLWKIQRRTAHGFIAESKFRSFVGDTSKHKVQDIVSILSKACDEGSMIDLHDVFLKFTFDTTCIMVMGVDTGCLSIEPKVVPFAKAMDDAEEVILIRHVFPMACWKLFRWLRVGGERRIREAQSIINSFVKEEISRKKEAFSKGKGDRFGKEDGLSPDLLSSYLNSDFRSEVSYSNEFLRDTVVNLLLAGRDTTASGLSWFFYLVSTHFHVRDQILLELHGVQKAITSDGMATFKAESVSPLVFLHATLLETLRLYPPVPFEHKRAVKEDVLPSGHRVKKGMEVFVSLYALARMEGVWGADCKEFRPERWINDKGKLRYEPSYKFLSFNSGPRTCLGKDMAITQMKVVVATLLWNFEIGVVDPREVRPKVSIILHMKEGLKITVKRRAKGAFQDMDDLDRAFILQNGRC